MSNRKPTEVDKQLSANIRRTRKAKKMTIEGLAEKLDCTFQQVQKYETAFNRVSVGRLYGIARALDVHVIDLLPDMETV